MLMNVCLVCFCLSFTLFRFCEEEGEEEKNFDLSMGMSHDFETAIHQGSTVVRVGSLIFGERVQKA